MQWHLVLVREAAVVALVLDGHDNAAIAERRGTASRTVANPLARIFRKLGVASRGELVAHLSTSSHREKRRVGAA